MSGTPDLQDPRVAGDAIAVAADRLRTAETSRIPTVPVRDLIGSDDLSAAYSVQQHIVGDRVAAGATIVGRKIGLTSPAVQRQLGVDQPDFGFLFDDMAYTDGGNVPLSRLLQPKVETEIAFVLGRDLEDGALDVADVAAAVAYAVAAIEIVDSRIANWDITFGDTVADNASSGLFVLGDHHTPLETFSPVASAMRTLVDGHEVSTGTGDACLGDPLNALSWLARAAREHGDPLRAGQVILSGALGPMVPITGPCTVRAEITGLGSVSANFVKE
ncbi:2-keto-4-pentenoate hydratase [Gordonia sp. NPDC127522]|uniref:2-keto-4-pentenoate hydratase n=1 Tax=Gordonia sp. NPDC127522 TaxID=3345390 RepID=UPI00364380B9